MRQTRKQLIEENKTLARQLEIEREYNQAAEESNLAEAKGLVCKTCVHGVWVEIYGFTRMIGCDVTCSCEHYSRRADTYRSAKSHNCSNQA